jgi:microcompartment protein CcmK/EutM
MTIPRRVNGFYTKPAWYVDPVADQMKPVVTNVYKPTRDDLLDMRKNGIVEQVEKIVEVTDNNGTVKVALDENGTVVSTAKKPALTGAQMAMLAVGAFLLFGG